LIEAGHEVVGVDTNWFAGDTLGELSTGYNEFVGDIRDLEVSDLEGFDAVCHLAALSNDPLGNLNPELTHEINHRASVP
jgi:nucleoside-diphosphate-sugar epimerase